MISESANELLRAGMVHLLSGVLPLYVVNEFPKSGGTWVGQMLGRALGVPFPRNRFPVLRPSIMHGHYLSPLGIEVVTVHDRGPQHRQTVSRERNAQSAPQHLPDPGAA